MVEGPARVPFLHRFSMVRGYERCIETGSAVAFAAVYLLVHGVAKFVLAGRPGPSANLYGIRARSSSASRTMLAGLGVQTTPEGEAWPGTGPTGARQ